jgi:acyl carrier protein
MSATEEVHARVARVLAETLNADEEDVTPGATLQGDLGAESIDFLDIVFRLEREFGVRIPQDELFPDSILAGDPAFVQDGRVTDQGLAELRASLPHADLSGFEGDRRLSAIPDLFTVDMVSRYIAWKLGRDSQVDRDGHGPVLRTGSPSPGSRA